MTKKLKLTDNNSDDVFYLLGISSHEKIYRLSWALNQELNTELQKTGSFVLTKKGMDTPVRFECFVFDDEDSMVKYMLFANISEDGQAYLADKLRTFDFILKISGQVHNSFVKNIQSRLKFVNLVTASFVLDEKQQKALKFLTFD